MRCKNCGEEIQRAPWRNSEDRPTASSQFIHASGATWSSSVCAAKTFAEPEQTEAQRDLEAVKRFRRYYENGRDGDWAAVMSTIIRLAEKVGDIG